MIRGPPNWEAADPATTAICFRIVQSLLCSSPAQLTPHTLPLTTHAASDWALGLVPMLKPKKQNTPMVTHYLISKEVLEIVL